jgi:WD40 repeat protein
MDDRRRSWLVSAAIWISLWLAAWAAVLTIAATVCSLPRRVYAAPRTHQPTRWLWRDGSIAVSPNGEWLAVRVGKSGWRASRSWGVLWLLNLVSGEARVLESGLAFEMTSSGSDCVAFSPDSKVLAVAGNADDTSCADVPWFCGPNPSAQRSPAADYAVQLWDVSAGTEIPGLMPHKVTGTTFSNYATYVAFSAGGNYVAASSLEDVSTIPPFVHGSDNMVRLWKWPDAEPVNLSTSYHGFLYGLAFSPDSTRLAVAFNKHLLGKTHISLLDVEEREEVHRFDCGGGCAEPVFSPDGKILAVTTWHGVWAFSQRFSIRFWDVDTGEKLSDVPSAPWAGWSSAIFAPGSQTLAVREPDDTIAFWDGPSGREIRKLAFPEGAPAVFVFTPDGKALIGGGAEVTPVVHMWDANTGKELRQWDLSGLFPKEMKVSAKQ